MYVVITLVVGGFKESAELLSQPNDAKVALFFGFAMDLAIFFSFFFRGTESERWRLILTAAGVLYCPNIIFFCRLSRISAKTFAKKSSKKKRLNYRIFAEFSYIKTMYVPDISRRAAVLLHGEKRKTRTSRLGFSSRIREGGYPWTSNLLPSAPITEQG